MDLASSAAGRIRSFLSPLTLGREELFSEPRVPAAPLDPQLTHVSAGIFYKYINFGKGWRPRLFVCKNGVLQYCKMASIRESSSDTRKFYVYSGTKTIECRCESRQERAEWIQVLARSRHMQDILKTEDSVLPSPDAARELKPWERVLSRMSKEGVAPELVGELQEWVVGEMRTYWMFAQKEAEKRRLLLQYVRQLEEEKRHLEDQVVHLSKEVHDASHGAGRRQSLRRSSGSAVNGESSAPLVIQSQRSKSFTAEATRGELAGRVPSAVMGSALKPEDYERDSVHDEHEAATSESGDDEDVLIENHSWDTFQDCIEQDLPDIEGGAFSPSRSNSSSPDLRSMALSRAFSHHPLPSPTANGKPHGLPPANIPESLHERASTASSSQTSPVGTLSRQLSNQLALPAWLVSEPEHIARTALPKPQQVLKPVSLWSVVKDSVGKDLNRLWLPVYFNEPLSITQRCAEELEYTYLLDRAGQMQQGSAERLLYVAAFAVSAYSSTPGRTFKPFNPMLGETYEYVCRERGFRFMCEKVVHSPNIFGMWAEGRNWVMEADCEFRHKFLGYAIIVNPAGVLQVTFQDGEVVRWGKVTTSINNIIIGKIYIDHSGVMEISSSVTDMIAKVTFREQGFFEKDPHLVKGHVEQGGVKVPGTCLYGHWDRDLAITVQGQARQVWAKAPPPEDPTRYQLTTFSMALNELPEWLTERLPPTDSRLRPDLRALERGIYDEATSEKRRLEEKQRAARRLQDATSTQPRWFETTPGAKIGQQLVYKFTGEYWSCREARSYTGCRDIFGPS